MKGDKSTMNHNDNRGGLKIQVEKKLFEFKLGNLLRLVGIIIISIICGALAAGYITSVYVSEIEETIIISQEDKQITDGIQKVLKSIVTVSNSEEAINKPSDINNTSGIIINEKGYIITNYSKINNYDKIYIKITDVAMEPIEAYLIGKNEDKDMALVKIDMEGLNAIKFASSKDINIGQIAYAIGKVYTIGDSGMVTVGRITSQYEGINGKHNMLLQTDAIVNEDNSGGALCDINGKLLGMLSDKISKEKAKNNLYYAVNIDEIQEFYNDIIKRLNVMGIEEKTVVIGDEKWLKGVYINSVNANGMAEKAGLKPTDIIVELDGQKINYIEDIFLIIENKKQGESIKGTILREGKEKEIELVITKDNN